jgi:hypothetical protein
MISARERIIPARFLLTLGHFIAVLLVNYTKNHNIYAVHNNPTSSQKSSAVFEVEVHNL